MVNVNAVSKFFGQTKAVDNLSFVVDSGEILGLLGPNGAGKTTTMRMMTGFLAPDSGRIETDGINVSLDPIKARRMIGYLPENNPLYKEMLVSDFLKYSAGLKNINGLELIEAIDFAVMSVSLEDVYYRPIGELSKGYKQRVGIAATLLHRPKILIMDEPSEGLDPNQRTEIRTLIKKLSKEHTIIISTHVMQEVEAVCDRMIIINKGRIVADGSPQQLLRQAYNKNEIDIVIEGKNIEKKLRSVESIENISRIKIKNNRTFASLTVKKGKFIQPEISRISAKEGWIIWKIGEPEKQLEDLFHLLTSEKTYDD